MSCRYFASAAAALMICALPLRTARAQAAPIDSLPVAPAIRPLEAVVVTAKRESAFSSAMARLGGRATIATKQRENRRLARQLAAYDRAAFGLERKLDSLMIVATIHEVTIARTDSATNQLRAQRLQLEARLCQTAPGECLTATPVTRGAKGD